VNHDVGTNLLIQTDDRVPVAEIVLFRARDNNRTTTALLELLDNKRSEKAGAAGDENTFIGPEGHRKEQVKVKVKVKVKVEVEAKVYARAS
jgi:hypothetical protein